MQSIPSKILSRLSRTAFTRIALLVCFVWLVVPAHGQTFRGTIHGRVVDPSGALLPNATITAKNLNTGIERTAVTNDSGEYVLPEMDAGRYEITTATSGFQKTSQTIVVNVGADTEADISIGKIAATSETVEVSEQAPLINTERNVLGALVEDRLVQSLPLNGRDFGKLVALTPGVSVEGSGVAGTEKGFGQFNVNGNRDRSNNYLLDGTDNNDPFFNNSALNQVGITGAPASLLPLDAIQEFNIQSSYGAEYGRNAGGVVNVITKSGTNLFHGSVFDYVRNSAFDARNYFNTRIDQNGAPARQSPFRNNNFGGSIGGPVLKDKTFFFLAYEGQREAAGSDFLLTLPTPDEIAQARAIAQENGAPVINPGLDKVLSFFPASTTGSLNSTVKDTNNLDSFIARADHHFTENQQLSGRYAFSQGDQIYPLGSLGGFGSGSRLASFAQTSPTRVQVASVSFLSVLRPTLVNEVRLGYSRYRTSFSSLDAKLDPASIGLNTGTGEKGLPEFDFSGVIENLGATAFSVPRGRTSQTFQALDDVTWTLGKHVIKFGGEYRRASIDSFNDNLERGLLFFSPGTVTDLNGNPIANQPDDSVVQVLANFYLGNGNGFSGSANTGNTQRTTRNNNVGFFAQDDYKLRSNFTLNYGLRWEYFGPLSEEHNLLSNLATDGTLALVGTHGLHDAYQKNWLNFAPRVGFAWQTRPTTVVHGGYGIYYDYIPQDVLIANFTNSAGLATNPIGQRPVLPLNFDQNAYAGNTGPFYSPSTSGPYSVFVTPRSLPTPYSQSWNLNVQQEFTTRISLEFGYVGSKGTHLTRLYDANQPDAFGNRPNSGFQTIDTFADNSWSHYDALQSTLRAHNSRGLSGLVTYTWSKSLDTASDGIDFNFASAALPQDSTNLKAEYGASTFDTRNRFTSALSYTVPVFHALPERVAKGWELNSIITAQSGRPIPIVTSFDTTECSFDPATCPNGGGSRDNFHQRPNVVPGINPVLPNASARSGYLNPAAFSQPDLGFGTLARNSVYGPHFVDVDFAVSKSTQISERFSVLLRAESFNILNHPNFALPNGSFGSSSFGAFSQTPDVAQGNPGLGGGGPRVLQFALRLSF